MSKAILEFCPLQIDYRLNSENKVEITIYGTTNDNKKILVIDKSFMPHFYALFDEKANLQDILLKVSKIPKVKNPEICMKKLFSSNIYAIKIHYESPNDLDEIKDELKKIYDFQGRLEFDIKPHKQYLIERKITPLGKLRVIGKEEDKKDLNLNFLISAEKIEEIEKENDLKFRMLAFDIETYNPGNSSNMEKDPIIMISIKGNYGFNKLLTWKKFLTSSQDIEFLDSEMNLIQRFFEILNQEKPDFLWGYSSDNFDLAYIKARAKKYKIKENVGYDNSGLQILKSIDPPIYIKGINHLDLYKFVRYILGPTLETDTYSLDSVANEIINEGKLDGIKGSDIYKYWDGNENDIKHLSEYSMKDAELTLKLAENLFPIIAEMSRLIGQNIFEISRSTYGKCVELFLMKSSVEKNEFIPNKPISGIAGQRMERTYEGGYVYQPQPGIYNNIAIFDFRSLYPSIIVAHNICPSTLKGKCPENQREYLPNNSNIWFCKDKVGFIPSVIRDLVERRKRIKEILKNMKPSDKSYTILNARSYAIKTIANAMYGYLGFSNSRWYNLDCASAITNWGRYYIQKAISEAEKQNFKVIYGDTDSLMIAFDKLSKKEAIKFVEQINKKNPEDINLELQGFYPRGIFVSKKIEIERGAKKKYALLDSNGNIIIKGMEYVRRGWCELAKKIQMEVLKKILIENSKEGALKIVKDAIEKLRKNEITIDDIVIYTQITRNLDEYESVGPHVSAAKKAREEGVTFPPGSIIPYIIVKGEGSISERAYLVEMAIKKNMKYDPEYYINNQIIPSIEKIFEVLGYSKEELLGKTQTNLKGFFN